MIILYNASENDIVYQQELSPNKSTCVMMFICEIGFIIAVGCIGSLITYILFVIFIYLVEVHPN